MASVHGPLLAALLVAVVAQTGPPEAPKQHVQVMPMPPGGLRQVKEDFNCWGGDLMEVVIHANETTNIVRQDEVVGTCRAACLATVGCKAWSLNHGSRGRRGNGHCWLKHDCDDGHPDPYAISGFVDRKHEYFKVPTEVDVEGLLNGLLQDTNCWGNDIAEVAIDTSAAPADNLQIARLAGCRGACMAKRDCMAWTLNHGSTGLQGKGHCWLKSSCAGKRHDSRAMSGLIVQITTSTPKSMGSSKGSGTISHTVSSSDHSTGSGEGRDDASTVDGSTTGTGKKALTTAPVPDRSSASDSTTVVAPIVGVSGSSAANVGSSGDGLGGDDEGRNDDRNDGGKETAASGIGSSGDGAGADGISAKSGIRDGGVADRHNPSSGSSDSTDRSIVAVTVPSSTSSAAGATTDSSNDTGGRGTAGNGVGSGGVGVVGHGTDGGKQSGTAAGSSGEGVGAGDSGAGSSTSISGAVSSNGGTNGGISAGTDGNTVGETPNANRASGGAAGTGDAVVIDWTTKERQSTTTLAEYRYLLNDQSSTPATQSLGKKEGEIVGGVLGASASALAVALLAGLLAPTTTEPGVRGLLGQSTTLVGTSHRMGQAPIWGVGPEMSGSTTGVGADSPTGPHGIGLPSIWGVGSGMSGLTTRAGADSPTEVPKPGYVSDESFGGSASGSFSVENVTAGSRSSDNEAGWRHWWWILLLLLVIIILCCSAAFITKGRTAIMGMTKRTKSREVYSKLASSSTTGYSKVSKLQESTDPMSPLIPLPLPQRAIVERRCIRTAAPELFDILDTNHDGVITRAEFDAAMGRSQALPTGSAPTVHQSSAMHPVPLKVHQVLITSPVRHAAPSPVRSAAPAMSIHAPPMPVIMSATNASFAPAINFSFAPAVGQGSAVLVPIPPPPRHLTS